MLLNGVTGLRSETEEAMQDQGNEFKKKSDDDVEGHRRVRVPLTDDGVDDVEGHRRVRMPLTDDGVDDVEGHVQPRGGIDRDRI